MSKWLNSFRPSVKAAFSTLKDGVRAIAPAVAIAIPASIVAIAAMPDPAVAAGLSQVNTVMTNLQTTLSGIADVSVACAVMWAGYKALAQRADIMEILKILGAGVLIGGSTEFASWLLGS